MNTLEVRGLSKEYAIHGGWRRSKLVAVDDVSFTLESGKTLALVGQSGSGKSTVAKLIARLETPTKGGLALNGEPVGSGRRAMRDYRSQVQMVFQDPFASLNPHHTVLHHLVRPQLLHGQASSPRQAAERAHELLERVNLTPAGRFAGRRPHELSGGQRQRVAIARALAPRPSILVADEPVSMLDVSIRLDVLNLLARLQEEDDLAFLYITHDLATARHFSDEILVMYHGRVVERGPADEVILHPREEFTQALCRAAPEPATNSRFIEEARRRGVPMPDHAADLAALEEF